MSLAVKLIPVLSSALALALPVGAAPTGLDLDLYDRLLVEHTREVDDTALTRVDYRSLRASREWRKLVASLAAAQPERLSTDAERAAFWINAYNIFAIETIVEHPGIDGIRDIGSFFSPVWDREAGHIGAKTYTLGHIEHEILRKTGDPRIHGAVICASVSCPPLRREAWRAERLEQQYADSLGVWLRDTRKGLKIDTKSGRVRISKIFDWFQDDFEKVGGVIPFVSKYATDADRAWLEAHPNPAISYFDYDWSLNALPGRS